MCFLVINIKNVKMINMNEELVKLRVHIAPIGFEIDRVIQPLIHMKADQVWLIVEQNIESGDAAYFYQEIIKQLKKLKIPVKEKRCDIHSLYDILNAYRTIIEQEPNNLISVNVSTGTKVEAIAGMMACMIFKDYSLEISPYYVRPEKYEKPPEKQQYSSGYKGVVSLPNYKIEKPKEELIKALTIIELKKGQITKKSLIEECEREGLIKVEMKKSKKEEGARNVAAAKHSQLNSRIVGPLLKWKFITIEGKGKSGKIRITQDGQNILRFLS
jgi:hypothetical protein